MQWSGIEWSNGMLILLGLMVLNLAFNMVLGYTIAEGSRSHALIGQMVLQLFLYVVVIGYHCHHN